MTSGCVTVESRDRACRVNGRVTDTKLTILWKGVRCKAAAGRPQVATYRDVAREVDSRDRPRRIDGIDLGGPYGRARNIDVGECAVWRSQEAMGNAIRVTIASNDQSRRVDARSNHVACLTDVRPVEYGDDSVRVPDETTNKKGGRRRKKIAYDGPCRVNDARKVYYHIGIERRKGAVRRPHEAVAVDRVTVFSCDHATFVDSDRKGFEYCAWNIERGEAAVESAQEAVNHEACVSVASCDHPGRVNAGADGTGYAVRDIERGDSTRREPERSRGPCHLRRCSPR